MQRIADTRDVRALLLEHAAHLQAQRSFGLVVAPTTRDTLALAREGNFRIVGDPSLIPGALSTSRLLQELRTHCSESPVIAFSDQLVDAVEAPLAVSRAGSVQFIPALEVLTRAQYGQSVWIWDGEQFEACDDVEPTAILRQVAKYFDECELLGDAWLMSARQVRRQPADRSDQAMRRLRHYQSTVFFSGLNEPLELGALGVVRELGRLRSDAAKVRS